MDLNFATEVRLGEEVVSEIRCSDDSVLWKTGEWPAPLDLNVFFRRQMIAYPAYARGDGVRISGIVGTRSVWNGLWLRTCDDSFDPVDAVVDGTSYGGGELQGVHFVIRSQNAWRYAQEQNGTWVQVFTDELKAYPWPVTTLYQMTEISLDSVYENHGSATFSWREYVEEWDPEQQQEVQRTLYSGTGTAEYAWY